MSKMRKADQIKNKQREFVHLVGNLRSREELVIYIDETTFNVWQIPPRISARSDDLDVNISSNRGSSYTLIGAIDSFRGGRYYTAFKGSNSSNKFLEFLIGLHNSIGYRHAYLVLDNLAIHHSKLIRAATEKIQNVQLVFLPPYSCNLNPIEKLWSLVKHKWRKILLRERSIEITQETKIISLIQSCIDSITSETVKKVFLSCNKDMTRSLKDFLSENKGSG